jgi:flagellar biogenesis protein FliO
MITTFHVAVIVGVIMAALLLRLLQSRPIFAGWRSGATVGGIMVNSAGRLVLSAGHTIHVIRIEERLLVLAVHSGGCSLLATLPQQHHGGSQEEGSLE